MAAPAQRRRGESGGRADKRAAILDAAVELFLAGGYDQTSMDAVALRADVSKTTVYAHFGDKLGLFRAMAERAVTLMDVDLDQLRLDTSRTPEETLVHVVESLVEANTSDTFLAFQRIMITESDRRPELTQALGKPDAPKVVGVVAGILTDDAAQHGYKLPNADALADLFVRMALASLQLDALLDSEFRPKRRFIAQHARWVTTVFLEGVRIDPARPGRSTPPAPPAGYTYQWFPARRR